MRLVFMGTPEYAAISLQGLIDAGYEVAGVFTQPDRPSGRGNRLVSPPAKQAALRQGIPVFQPERIRRDGTETLKSLQPDLCVTAAYGQILSPEILAVPKLGTVNVHASLLPKYRGSSPVNWAIINGETKTGVSTMMTDAGIDTGDILLQRPLDILPDETAGELTIRLANAGAALLIETLKRLTEGRLQRRKQNEAEMSYYPMLRKDHGFIEWQKPADEIVNLVRGVQPWPGAATDSPWGILKILSAKASSGDNGQEPGTILLADSNQGLWVQTGVGRLEILVLQAPGGKAMASKDYLRGHLLMGHGAMSGIEGKQ